MTEGFEAQYLECHQDLYYIALSILRDKSYAEDAIQETAIKAYRNYGQLKEKQYFKTWITRILVNNCKYIIRKYKSSDTCLSLFPETEQVVTDELNEIIQLYQVIRRLNQKEQELITLRYISDMTVDEISRIMNLPEGTVKSRLNRTINKLKKLIRE